jgi:hypothetical protein
MRTAPCNAALERATPIPDSKSTTSLYRQVCFFQVAVPISQLLRSESLLQGSVVLLPTCAFLWERPPHHLPLLPLSPPLRTHARTHTYRCTHASTHPPANPHCPHHPSPTPACPRPPGTANAISCMPANRNPCAEQSSVKLAHHGMLGCGWAVPSDGPTVRNSPRLKARTAADITVPSLAIVTLLHPVPGAQRRCRPAHACTIARIQAATLPHGATCAGRSAWLRSLWCCEAHCFGFGPALSPLVPRSIPLVPRCIPVRLHVCVRVCVRVCLSVCVRVRVRARVSSVCACVRVGCVSSAWVCGCV